MALTESDLTLSHKDWWVSHIGMSTLGVLLLAVGAVGLGWLPPLADLNLIPVIAAMRLTPQGVFLGRLAIIVGGTLLLHSWLVLGLYVLRDRSVSMRQLQLLLAVWTVVLLPVPPIFSRDVYSYVAQGRLLVAGIDPYTHGVGSIPGWFQIGSDPLWAESPTPYGPVFLLIQHAILLLVPSSPFNAMLLFRLTCVVGLVLIATAVPRLARGNGIAPEAAFWLGVCNPMVISHLIAGVHNDALMIGFMLWAFVFAMDRRWLATLALATCAIGIKPIALFCVPFLILTLLPRQHSLRTRWSAWVGGTLAITAMLLAVGRLENVGFGWVSSLTTPGSAITPLSPSTLLAIIVSFVIDLFGVDSLNACLAVFRLAGLALALGICAWLVLRPEGRNPIRGAALAATTIVMLSPVVHPWYLLWGLPLIAVVGLAKPWHLRAIVIGTAFFCIYSLTEVTVVTDSHLDVLDFVTIGAAALVVALVALVSPSERQLVFGVQFARGLTPLTAEAAAVNQSQKVQSP